MPGLDLRSVDPVLELQQRRFFDEQLPEGARTADFKAFNLARFDDDVIAWARAAWEARALDEYRSQLGFSELLVEVTELGCGYDVITAAVRLVRDEARHVEVCRRFAVTLGSSGVMPRTPSFVRSDASRTLLERVLRSITGSLCLGETLSSALLGAMVKVTHEPLARAVVKVLARDESFHSQLGWQLLPLFWPLANQPMKRRLTRQLTDDVAWAEQAVAAGCDDDGRTRNPMGDLLTAERTRVSQRAIERDVLRRFERLGINVPRAAVKRRR